MIFLVILAIISLIIIYKSKTYIKKTDNKYSMKLKFLFSYFLL
jgi:hypothetical protein